MAPSWHPTFSPQVRFPGGEERGGVGVQGSICFITTLRCWEGVAAVLIISRQRYQETPHSTANASSLEAFCPLEGRGCNIFLLSLTQTWRMSSLTRSRLLEACIFPSAQDSKVPGTKQGDTLKRNCFREECLGKARKTVVIRYHVLRQTQRH